MGLRISSRKYLQVLLLISATASFTGNTFRVSVWVSSNCCYIRMIKQLLGKELWSHTDTYCWILLEAFYIAYLYLQKNYNCFILGIVNNPFFDSTGNKQSVWNDWGFIICSSTKTTTSLIYCLQKIFLMGVVDGVHYLINQF